MTPLGKVRDLAKKLGIPFLNIIESPIKTKKYRIELNDGTKIDFGARNSITFLDGASDEKRNLYNKRHSQIFLKDGRRAIDIKYSPAWLSWHLLWNF